MGTLSNYKPKILTNCLTRKLHIGFGSGGERSGWYYLDGKKRLHVTIPHVHGKDISPYVMRRIISSLRLDKAEFRRLYECPMKGSDFESKIRDFIEAGKI